MKPICICIVCQTEHPHHALGMCNPCYQRTRQHELGVKPRKVIPYCDECKTPTGPFCKGMCRRCYGRFGARRRRKDIVRGAALRAYGRKWMRELRKITLAAYGGKCVCCAETRFEFLAIDHINGGGERQRRQMNGSGKTLYLLLRKQGYPPEYRVMCHNCNSALGFYHYCPHARDIE